MREKTGGAAFPTPRFMVDDESRILGFSIHTDGMSLRDYFAIKALQPLTKSFLEKELDLEDPMGWMGGLASDAYAMADAMLKAREE
jgi:hypothetical protein